jgi:hypothetical protein
MPPRHGSTLPVPIGPLHRRTWRTLWRRCTCGLPEPCVDRLTTTPLPPVPPAVQPNPSFPSTPQALPEPTDAHPSHLTLRPGTPGVAGTGGNLSHDTYHGADGAGFHGWADSLSTSAAATQMLPVLGEPLPSPGRAGNLTPAQSSRADHALCTRGLLPSIRAAPPGRAGRPTGFAGLDPAPTDPYPPHHHLASSPDGGHPDPSRTEGSRAAGSRMGGSRS